MFATHGLAFTLAFTISLLPSSLTFALIPVKDRDYRELETRVALPKTLHYLRDSGSASKKSTVIQFTSLNCPLCSKLDEELERETQGLLKAKVWKLLFQKAQVIKVHRLQRDETNSAFYNKYDSPFALLYHSLDFYYQRGASIEDVQWSQFLQNIRTQCGRNEKELVKSKRTEIASTFIQCWKEVTGSSSTAPPMMASSSELMPGSLEEWHHCKEYLSSQGINPVEDSTIQSLADFTEKAQVTRIPAMLVNGRYLIDRTMLPKVNGKEDFAHMLEVVNALLAQ